MSMHGNISMCVCYVAVQIFRICNKYYESVPGFLASTNGFSTFISWVSPKISLSMTAKISSRSSPVMKFSCLAAFFALVLHLYYTGRRISSSAQNLHVTAVFPDYLFLVTIINGRYYSNSKNGVHPITEQKCVLNTFFSPMERKLDKFNR